MLDPEQCWMLATLYVNSCTKLYVWLCVFLISYDGGVEFGFGVAIKWYLYE